MEEGIVMSNEVLYTVSQDEIEEMRQFSKHKYELDRQSELVYAMEAAVEKGLSEKQGRDDFFQQNFGQFIQEIRELSMFEGMRDGMLAILNLLKRGVPPEDIIRDYHFVLEYGESKKKINRDNGG